MLIRMRYTLGMEEGAKRDQEQEQDNLAVLLFLYLFATVSFVVIYLTRSTVSISFRCLLLASSDTEPRSGRSSIFQQDGIQCREFAKGILVSQRDRFTRDGLELKHLCVCCVVEDVPVPLSRASGTLSVARFSLLILILSTFRLRPLCSSSRSSVPPAWNAPVVQPSPLSNSSINPFEIVHLPPRRLPPSRLSQLGRSVISNATLLNYLYLHQL
jgi:hypothetical protein